MFITKEIVNRKEQRHTSEIILKSYNAANPGVFTKDVTVKFVNYEIPVVLNITGEVIDMKGLTTPKKEINSAKQ